MGMPSIVLSLWTHVGSTCCSGGGSKAQTRVNRGLAEPEEVTEKEKNAWSRGL